MDSKRNKPLPATSEEEEGEFRRNWSGLPELALHSISRRLPSIPDFLSFSSVCTSWNSLTSSSSSTTDFSTSFPPLLLLPVLPSPHPPPPPPPDLKPNSMRNLVLRAERCLSRSFHPTHFLLQTLTLEEEEEEEEEEILPKRRRSFISKIPSETLTLPCLGYTDGSLVFLSAHDNLIILADAFSGTLRRILLPPGYLRHLLQPPGYPLPRTPLLAAAGTHLLLASESVILSYRLQTDTWSQLDHGAFSLAAVKDQVFCIGPDYNRLAVIGSTADAAAGAGATSVFRSRPSRPTGVSLPALPEFSTLCRSLGRRLVACGSDLLLLRVRLLITDRRHDLDAFSHVLDVFRLDSESSTWAEVESLEDWCLFLDAVGSSAAACPDPARWGGRSNCAYVTGPGCDSWVAVPLDGDRQFVIDDGDGREYDICKSDAANQIRMGNPTVADICTCEELLTATKRISELHRTNNDAMLHEFGTKLRWPSPVWVYPSMRHSRKKMKNFVSLGSVSGCCVRLLRCILSTAASFQLLHVVADRSFQPNLALITMVHTVWNFVLAVQDLYASVYGSNHGMTLAMLTGDWFVWGMSNSFALGINSSGSVSTGIRILMGLTCGSWILVALSAVMSLLLFRDPLSYDKASTETSKVGGVGTKPAADSIVTGY